MQRILGCILFFWAAICWAGEQEDRQALYDQTRTYLNNEDFLALEKLYNSFKKKGNERSKSGIWRQVVFFNQLKWYSNTGNDQQHWESMRMKAGMWRSRKETVPSLMFSVYVNWAEAVAKRGNLPATQLTREQIIAYQTPAMRAYYTLYGNRELLSKDPEYYRAMAVLLPYAGGTREKMQALLREAIEKHPYYHETFFRAAHYMQSHWFGRPGEIDAMAREVTAATRQKEGRSYYARLYWFLNGEMYNDDLFRNSQANWEDMRDGFRDMIRQYPDSWNVNAFAYFACRAGDFATMRELLGKQKITIEPDAWGRGKFEAYSECLRQEAQAANR